MVIGNLPSGWTWATIGEISTAQSGAGFPKTLQGKASGDYPLAKVSDITDAVKTNSGIISRANNYLSVAEAKKLGAKVFPEGTTLFAKIGEAVGLNRRALSTLPILADNNVMGLIPNKNSVAAKFLYYFMQTIDLYEYSQATTVPSVRKGDVEQIAFPLPPLYEQERIVAKIEELFTQLDAGTAALKRVWAGLKRYKASVLKAAVEGRLFPVGADGVRPMMETGVRPLGEEASQAQAGRTPSALTEGELPDGWRWTTVGELTQKMQYGTSEKADLDDVGIPVLRMGNIQNGELDFSNLKYLPETTKGLNEIMLEPGDMLFNRTNSAELVGKTAIYREHHPRATLASYLIRVKLKLDIVLPDFVSFYINSFYGRKYISSVVSQQVGQANVNGTKLANMPIPLPPLAEQRRIVAEVERRLSVVKEVESVVAASVARASRLRQAVLKSAFEGRLC